jgi:hypothetical protein
MKKHIPIIISFIVGALVALLVMYFSYFQYCKSNWNKQEFNTGYIKAKIDVYNKTKDEFGDSPSKKEEKILFSVKDGDVIVITVDGVKTIRVR